MSSINLFPVFASFRLVVLYEIATQSNIASFDFSVYIQQLKASSKFTDAIHEHHNALAEFYLVFYPVLKYVLILLDLKYQQAGRHNSCALFLAT